MAHLINNVLVVGAGPTGLLLALLLAQHDIPVEVVEAGESIDERPRGLAYGPAATRVLRRAGVLGEIRQRSWDLKDMSWRRLGGDYLCGINDSMDNPDRTVLYPVHMLSHLLIERLRAYPTATVHMGHKVINVGQDDEKAWIEVTTGAGSKRMEGDFVVGCDGASSAVRKALFGARFPGHTWESQIVVLNMYYDIEKFGWSDCQFVVDPECWGIVCGISKADRLWRVGYGEPLGLTNDQLWKRMPEKLEKLLPGSPKPEDYEVIRFSPFVMHQRCAERMSVGRAILVGDAAHLCNPIGGLGLTSGIADVGSLIDCLCGIDEGRASLDILTKYDEIRRGIYYSIINPLSSTNLERLYRDPDYVLNTDASFELMKQAAKNPAVAVEFQQLRMNHDMTQYYKTEKPVFGQQANGSN